jgi:hypothetical protein
VAQRNAAIGCYLTEPQPNQGLNLYCGHTIANADAMNIWAAHHRNSIINSIIWRGVVPSYYYTQPIHLIGRLRYWWLLVIARQANGAKQEGHGNTKIHQLVLHTAQLSRIIQQ